MWELLKQWYNEHRVLIGLLLLASIGVGLLAVGLCAFFPPMLLSIASLTLFGLAPLAFLTTIQLPWALFSLGVIAVVAAFALGSGSALVINQLFSIVPHVWALWDDNTITPTQSPTHQSYSYLQAHLITTDYVEDASNDYDDDISSSNSSEQDELPRSNSNYFRPSSRSSLRPDTESEHSTFINFSPHQN